MPSGAAAPENTAPRDRARVLVVDDDPDMVALLGRWLHGAGIDCATAANGAEALTQLDLQRPDLVLTDLVMDEMDGLRLLKEIHRFDPVMPVIMLSGEAGVDEAMKAAHLGVSAFLTKPPDRDALLREVTRALERGAGSGDSQIRFGEPIVYRSALMAALMDKARLVAASDCSVLVTGATGTGKELMARAIHDASPRRDKPFVSLNCSAIPDQLLESELFGHEKGAFTGAVSRHEGLFQAADRGTLFLDEIGDMPMQLQAKLLRVLQDFQVRPVGATQSFPVNVRIVSATHQDLDVAVAERRFREDLYYRLSVVPLHLPSLDERREDIGPIVDHLVARLCERNRWPPKRFTPQGRELLQSATWPGNVRQLANVVEQCLVLSTGDLIPMDLVHGAMRNRPAEVPGLDDARRAFERRYLIDVLRICNGNVSGAARIAGRNRTEFYKLLGRHYLDPATFRDDSNPAHENPPPDEEAC
jgi:two-component system response regulator GlrR